MLGEKLSNNYKDRQMINLIKNQYKPYWRQVIIIPKV